MIAEPTAIDLPPYAAARLDVLEVTLARGERELARGITFALGDGEAILLRGRNGSGKTTLLRALAGFTPIAAGEITMSLATLEAEPSEAIAFVGHADGLRRTETPRRHLDFAARWFGADPARVAPALQHFHLWPIADAPARRLSAGQRRRAALARLIAAPRPIWLLDEPAAPLDAAGRRALAELVAAHRGAGGSVIAAVHDDPEWPDVLPLDLEDYIP